MTTDNGTRFSRRLRSLILIIALIYATTAAEEKWTIIDFKSEHMNKVLTTHVIAVYEEWSNYRCAFRCLIVNGCLSMSYNRQTQDCLLHSVNSSSAKIEDFLALAGFIFSDLVGWNMKNVCNNKTCVVGEACFPTGSRHICKNASSEGPACSENSTSLNCYLKFKNKDLADSDHVSVIYRSPLVDCIKYCNTKTPAYETILRIKYRCYCKSKSVWSYIADGRQLQNIQGVSLFQRIR